MKKLESLKEFQINNEINDILGGSHVSGSFSAGGSVYTYNGDMGLTQDSTPSLVVYTGSSYVSDFCGATTCDGGARAGCAQYIRGHWVAV